jgi:hypothetical protein
MRRSSRSARSCKTLQIERVFVRSRSHRSGGLRQVGVPCSLLQIVIIIIYGLDHVLTRVRRESCKLARGQRELQNCLMAAAVLVAS